MNESNPNNDISTALGQLPDAPAHGEGFWDELNTSLSMQSVAETPDQRGRRPFGLLAAVAAAAAVVVGGVLAFGSFSDPNPTVLLEAAEATTTTVQEATTTPSTQPSTQPPTTQAATTTTAPATDSSVLFPERVTSDRFLYDVGLPDSFRLVSSSGRGIRIEGPFNTTFETTNVIFGDVDTLATYDEAFGQEELVQQSQITIPLFDRESTGLIDRGVILAVDQWTYRGGLQDNRVVRVYNFNDRSIRAELAWDNAPAATFMPTLLLDDIRMFNAALDLPECSSFGLTPHATPAELNEAQAITYDAILQALETCDWNALEALIPISGFSASFGGGEAPDLWRTAEAYGETPLDALHTTLGLEIGVDTNEAVWPKAFRQDWSDVSEASKEQLRQAGYTAEDFAAFAEIGFAGYRTAIDTNGNWTFFIAGD